MSDSMNDIEGMSRDELVAEVKRLRSRNMVIQMPVFKGVRKQSKATLWGLPLVSIARGPDPEKGEWCGHAKGIIAIGDRATGVLAIGGSARGGIAIGGFAIGAVAIGGGAIGLIALGGGALGLLALGGGAIGVVAIGGGAIGYYALGGGAFGVHIIDETRRSPEAMQFFERFIPNLREMLKLK